MLFRSVKKLIDINFCGIPPKYTLKRFEKLNKVFEMPEIPGFRKMSKKDSKLIQPLLNDYLKYLKIT